jgi:hypothetical protein
MELLGREKQNNTKKMLRKKEPSRIKGATKCISGIFIYVHINP